MDHAATCHPPLNTLRMLYMREGVRRFQCPGTTCPSRVPPSARLSQRSVLPPESQPPPATPPPGGARPERTRRTSA
eukprot:5731029-Prymnesium_polylepis.1